MILSATQQKVLRELLMPKPHPRPVTSESLGMGLKHLKAPQLIPNAAKVENHCFTKPYVGKPLSVNQKKNC